MPKIIGNTKAGTRSIIFIFFNCSKFRDKRISITEPICPIWLTIASFRIGEISLPKAKNIIWYKNRIPAAG